MHDDQPEPRTAAGFAACWEAASGVVDLDSRLPDLPFRAVEGEIRIAEYDYVLSPEFVPVLVGLMDQHNDDWVTLAVVDPTPQYYVAHYQQYPAVRLERSTLAEQYWDAISYEPAGDPTGAIAHTANVLAVTGSSGRWAVWGERKWDLLLVHTVAPANAWAAKTLPFTRPDDALRNFTFAYSGQTLDSPEAIRFLANLDRYTVRHA